MKKDDRPPVRAPVILGPGEGRDCSMGRIRANFKAHGAETANGYSISEWCCWNEVGIPQG